MKTEEKSRRPTCNIARGNRTRKADESPPISRRQPVVRAYASTNFGAEMTKCRISTASPGGNLQHLCRAVILQKAFYAWRKCPDQILGVNVSQAEDFAAFVCYKIRRINKRKMYLCPLRSVSFVGIRTYTLHLFTYQKK